MARTIPENKITWAMIPVYLLHMKGICVTPPSLRIQTLAEITFQKLYIRYYPLYTLVMQNKGSTQTKQKLPQISPFTKSLKGLILI